MIRLNYKLTQEEAVRYYEMILNNAKQTRVPRIFAMIWLPFVLLAVMIALKWTRNVMYWIAVIFLSLLWIFFLAPRLYHSITREAAKRKIKEDRFTPQNIEVKEENGVISVNGQKKQPLDYVAYADMLVIAFSDQTNLIVPDRVFGTDEKKMEQFVKDVVLSVKQQKEKATA